MTSPNKSGTWTEMLMCTRYCNFCFSISFMNLFDEEKMLESSFNF